MQLPRWSSIVLLLFLLLAYSPATSTTEQHDDVMEEGFTPEQLAKAREKLAGLFDDNLDADKDGKLTRTELSDWLARAAAEQANKDSEDSWETFNVTEGGSLDWDAYVAASKAVAMSRGGSAASDTAALQAEVRRAIEEASRETGIDKAGIKVSLPPPPSTTSADADSDAGQEQEHKFAIDLARDRRRWLAADANGDDRLDRREYRDFAVADAATDSPRMRPVVAAEALERLDSDGDGRVSEAEFLGSGPASDAAVAEEETKNFRQLWDTDKSGHLDLAEMERMLDHLDAPETMAKEAAEGRDTEAGDLIKSVDKDGDGSLSKAEVLDGLAAFAGSAATNYGDSVGIHDEL